MLDGRFSWGCVLAQQKNEQKRLVIRDAVIADVVEHGLDNAPVSRIAKRAGVSAGTIYIYYPNKERMLQSIFMEIKQLLHTEMMEAWQSGNDSAGSVRAMWFAMFRFVLDNPDMFAFHEALGSNKLLSTTQREDVSAMAQDMHSVLQAAIEDGTLKDMPIDCLAPLLTAPAVSFARRLLANGETATEHADLIFNSIWAGIARDP